MKLIGKVFMTVAATGVAIAVSSTPAWADETVQATASSPTTAADNGKGVCLSRGYRKSQVLATTLFINEEGASMYRASVRCYF
jgi:hypothetical protein